MMAIQDDVDVRNPEVVEKRLTTVLLVAVIAGAIAIVCAVLLPFARVTVNQPQVSWPLDVTRPESTSVMLDAGKPRSIDVEFSALSLREAARAADGVLISTVRPTEPTAGPRGLLVSASGGRVLVRSVGRIIYDQPLPTGGSVFSLHLDAGGAIFERDAAQVVALAGELLPDVDSLITSASSIPGASAGDLSVTVQVDDRFSSSPTPLKLWLVGLLLIALATSFVALMLSERDLRAPRRWLGLRIRRPIPVDFVVPAVMVVWVFVAPMTDDDGYYSAMAGNVPHEGYVAQYYQLFNQSFTPFSWYYYFFANWQELFGVSPIVLRIPALVVGLVTWTIIRAFAARLELKGRRQQAFLRVALGVAFLAWWLPYAMGVRPEAVVAMFAAGTLLAVVVAIERSQLQWAAIGVALAGLAITCHPTGFVALAPLVVGFPALVRLARSGGGLLTPLSRVVAVISAGTVASAAAFTDGTFYDFTKSQQIFLKIQEQNDWRDEVLRYSLLLSDIPMGSYAKRAAVLIGLLAFAWFAVLAVASRIAGVALPLCTSFAGWSLGLSFILLWITPSKWTHHFGALSGLGPVFLALFLVGVPGVVRRLTTERKLPWGALLLASMSSVLVIALAASGPNLWAYNWLLGMPHAGVGPFVSGVNLGSPVLWLVGLVVTAALARVLLRGTPSSTFFAGVLALPVLITMSFVVIIVYLVGSFSDATIRTMDTWSPGAANVRDPLARECVASSAVNVADIRLAKELQVQSGLRVGTASFTLGSGFYEPDPPPAPVGVPGGPTVWGSLQGSGLATSGISGAEGMTGTISSPWYQVAPDDQRSRTVVLAAGRLRGGNTLMVEYGKVTARSIDVRRTVPLDDGVDAPIWRSFILSAESGEDVVRLVAQDGTTGTGGWLSFSAPASAPLKLLQDYLPPDAPVGVAWQLAFLFPCQRKPVVQDGIAERSDYGVLWGQGGINGLYDNTWQSVRGGLFGPISKSASVTRVPAGLRDFPQVDTLQVYAFDYPYAKNAYILTRSRETVSGFSGP